MSIGPSLPPHLAHLSKASDEPEEIVGPQLPTSATSVKPAVLPSRPTSGPSFPPSGPSRPQVQEDSDSGDDIGPKPFIGDVADQEDSVAKAFKEREERQLQKEKQDKDAQKPKRDEWMLVPPKNMGFMVQDTTKMKGRGFSQSTRVSVKDSGPNMWTETPQERQQRLEDEVLGKKRKAESEGSDDDNEEAQRKRARDRKLKKEVEIYNKTARGETLLDAHQKAKASNKEDQNNPPAIWDRERDMSIGGRLMDANKRNNTIKNAKELGGRFGGSSYL